MVQELEEVNVECLENLRLSFVWSWDLVVFRRADCLLDFVDGEPICVAVGVAFIEVYVSEMAWLLDDNIFVGVVVHPRGRLLPLLLVSSGGPLCNPGFSAHKLFSLNLGG